MKTQLNVLLLDTKNNNPNHYICLAIQSALSESEEVNCVVKAGMHDAIDKAIKNKCNLFFAFDGEELNRDICARLSSICGQSILWVTEDPYELAINVSNSDLFDLVFTNDSACVKDYGDKGHHLPLAGAKIFHHFPIKEAENELRYDLFFAGTAWPNRVEFLKSLFSDNTNLIDFKSKIALPTNEHLPPLDFPLPASQTNWRTSPIDFARFANMSLSTVLLPRIFSSSGNKDFSETPPPRLFETALAGTVQLVHSKLTETIDYFEPGQDFLYFNTSTELTNLIWKLRTNIAWRNDIALNAQEKALNKHCYTHRVNFILSKLTNLNRPSDNTPSLVSNTFVKTKLLFVVHNVVEHGHFGGIEVYLQYLSKILEDDLEIYFYVPDRREESKAITILDKNSNIVSVFKFKTKLTAWQLSCAEREEAFSSAINRLKINAVHFHHLIGHPPSLVEIAKALGCSTYMTFHDYYSICHSYTLLSFKQTYCRPNEISLSQCDICLVNSMQLLPGSQATRRAYWNRILADIGTLVFNTQGSYELVSAIYPAVMTHNQVKILPVPMTPIDGFLSGKNSTTINPLKVAIIGNFTFHKGATTIARAITQMEHSNIEFHIFGRVDDNYLWIENNKNLPNVHVYGDHKPGNLPAELFACHISLHLSIWPETYCLTLSEAWECGLVPIVTDIGALGERVSDGINGLKITPDSEGELIQILYRLIETPKLIEHLQKNIEKGGIAKYEKHRIELQNLYRSDSYQQKKYIANKNQLAEINLNSLGRPVLKNWDQLPINTEANDHQLLTNIGTNQPILGLKQNIRRKTNQVLRNLQVYGFSFTLRKCIRYIIREF